MKLCFALAVFGIVAFAQEERDTKSLHPNLAGLNYPGLARQARIQGAVILTVSSDDAGIIKPKVISGHPILIPVVLDNIKKWKTSSPLKGNVGIVYLFVLHEPSYTTEVTRVPRGDALDRLFLKLFHQRTYTETKHDNCVNNYPADELIYLKDPVPEMFTVIVNGACPCLETVV